MLRAVLRRLGTALVLTLLVAAGAPLARAQGIGRPAPRFEVGEPFPSLLFPALDDGRPRTVADFRGEKLILHVFASW